jgi:hypothetical protein
MDIYIGELSAAAAGEQDDGARDHQGAAFLTQKYLLYWYTSTCFTGSKVSFSKTMVRGFTKVLCFT